MLVSFHIFFVDYFVILPVFLFSLAVTLASRSVIREKLRSSLIVDQQPHVISDQYVKLVSAKLILLLLFLLTFGDNTNIIIRCM